MNAGQFFSPPVFVDEEQTRVARLLHFSLLMIMGTVTFVFISAAFVMPENLIRWLVILFAVDGTHLALLAVNRLGKTWFAARAMVAGLWLIYTLASLGAGGIRGPAVIGYLIVILFAGLLLGERAGTFIGVFCVLTALSIAGLEIYGLLPANTVAHTPVSLWLAQVLYIVLAMSIQMLATRSIRNALHRARDELAERRRANTALLESEQRYRSLVLASAQVVWTTNPKGEIVCDIPSWRAFTGQSAKDILGQGWLDCVHPADREQTLSVWQQAIETRSVYETEYRLHRADGEWRHLSVRGVPVFEPDGRIREWVGLCNDITPRRKAEEEIQKLNHLVERIAAVTANITGEEYFRTLTCNLAELLSVRYVYVGQLTASGEKAQTLAFWSRNAFAPNFEFVLKDTPSANLIEGGTYVYPENVQAMFPRDNQLTKMNVESYCGTAIRGTNNQMLGILVVMDRKPLLNTGDRFRALMRIFAARAGMELERMQAGEALRKSEEKFAKAFKCSPVVLTIAAEKEMRFIAVNETFTGITGYQSDEVIGKTLREVGLLSQPGQIDDFLGTLISKGQVRDFEIEARMKNGEIRVGLVAAERIDIAGEPCVLSSTLDITDRRKAEAILRQSNEQLEQVVRKRTAELEASNKELEAFSYTVSHDLQAPLRAVFGFANALKEDYHDRLDDTGSEYLQRIVHASDRMTELISDLLAYSQIGRKPITLYPTQTSELAADIATDFETRMREIKGHFEASDLPEVLADRTLLTQVFTNLFQNAINYRRKDVPLRVKVSAESSGPDVIIGVHDNGSSIAPENWEKVFRAFERLHTDKETPGSGLGLATVKKAVETMGGRIWLDSEVGQGTTFYFTLKRAQTG